MQGFATVKAVLSGDTVLLQGTSSKGIPPEFALSIAFCQAPKVARSAEGIEESYGWESREYLRKMVIGQVVKFRVLYKVDSIDRSFGVFELKDKDVVHAVVENGWVSVRSEKDDHGQTQLYNELLELQVQAKERHCGIWSGVPSPRHVKWTMDDAEGFYKTNQGLPFAAVIEQVRDGSTVKAYLLETGEMISLHLAGVQCPRITYNAEGQATYELHSQEARNFTEVRLLNRSIILYLDGMDKFNNFYGHIEHVRGDIALELLKNGLAKMIDWSARYLPSEMSSSYRTAELAAKTQHLVLWKDYKAVAATKSVEGIVLQVLSGDCLVVLLLDAEPVFMGTQRRVYLSSVHAPKLGNMKKNVNDEAFAQEAKNALVDLAIGKKVIMSMDYERKGLSGTEETIYTYWSVKLDGKKGVYLGEEMVKKGLVTVVRHREDEPRAFNYDSLLVAEDDAKTNKKGIYSKRDGMVIRRVDYSENLTKAKTNLHFLMKKKLRAFVEYVHSASHYLLYIPRENCQISFSLQGVRAPMTSAKAGERYPYGCIILTAFRYH